ncbi:hypothetical protein E2320_007149, partial [Naja naja]
CPDGLVQSPGHRNRSKRRCVYRTLGACAFFFSGQDSSEDNSIGFRSPEEKMISPNSLLIMTVLWIFLPLLGTKTVLAGYFDGVFSGTPVRSSLMLKSSFCVSVFCVPVLKTQTSPACPAPPGHDVSCSVLPEKSSASGSLNPNAAPENNIPPPKELLSSFPPAIISKLAPDQPK